MASSDAATTTPNEKIPDSYSVPEWFKQRCYKDAARLVDVDSQLEIEDEKVVVEVKVEESTHKEEPLTKIGSESSSGRSSPVVVEAETQPIPEEQESISSTESEPSSQTTVTAADSSSSPEATDSTNASVEKDANTTTTDSQTSASPKISQSTYASLKDTFAPSLISNHQLLAFEQPSAIALSVNSSKELPLADTVVLQLAKDFNATAILLDAEDIEDLAWEFDRQQKGFDKIKKDKKKQEKAKKKQEKVEKRAAHEKKKLERAKKKADKEKKAAEKAEADKAEAEKAGTEKVEVDKKDDVSEKTADNTTEKSGDTTAEAVKQKPAEDAGKKAESAVASISVDEAKPAEKDTETSIQTEITTATTDSTAKASEDCPVKTAEGTAAEDKIKPETEGSNSSDEKPESTEEKPDAAKPSAESSDESSTEKKEEKSEDKAEDKSEEKSEDKPEENKEDEDEDDGPMSETDNDESDNNSDSDSEGMDYNIDTYEDPCRPFTKDTAYALSRTYFGQRGNSTRTRGIFKRSKAALSFFLQNKKEEPAVVVKVEESTSSDAADAESSKKDAEKDSTSTITKTVPAASEQKDSSKDEPVKDDAAKADPSAKSETPATSETPSTEDASPKQEEAKESDDTKSIKSSEPVLICIRDVNSIMSNDGGEETLGRFCDLISVCREAGRRAVLIVTLAQAQKPMIDEDCPCAYPWCGNKPKKLEKMLKRLKIDDSSKIDLIPPKPKKDENKDEIKDIPEEEEDKSKREYVNTRRLKRYLRHGASESLAKDWFDASAAWVDTDKSDGCLAKLQDKKWDDTRVRKAARQIIGRGVAAETFDFDDVFQVIARLDADSEKKSDDDDKKSEAAKAFEKKLEKIKAECNSHEERMLECIVKPADIDSTYDDVIVENDIKDAVRQLITLFKFKATTKSKKLLKLLNISGAMFYGPPGTGKTHLCRAMANDYGACMLALEASTLEDMWVGETEKLIRASFTLATKLHPCILFIDEADSLFRRRTSCDKSWERNALTMYLQQMDGINTNAKRPFVVVATNRPSDLDDAFLRRLPHKVFFNLPTEPQRAAILKLFLQEEDIDSTVDVNDLAKQTRGLSGSDLKSLCGQAVLAWATEKAISADSKDEDVTAELKLTAQHFKTAVKRTRPTVSRQAMADVDAFARQYDSARF